jgi:starch phosphorylase
MDLDKGVIIVANSKKPMEQQNNHLNDFLKEPRIAYFSMEIGVNNAIPTYSGGLGVLAGDTIRSGADLKLPMVAVTLISKRGYFIQDIDERGRQRELPAIWEPSKYMTLLPQKAYMQIEGRDVAVQAWLYIVKSLTSGSIPVLFLDTDIEENTQNDREITSYLYGGDQAYRLKQEALLGIGGVRMLHELGFEIKKYHMNEGHAALLTLELLLRYKKQIEDVWDEKLVWDINRVRAICVFTTHTPVEAGHDKFPYDLVLKTIGELIPLNIFKELGGAHNLNMTLLGLNLSEFVNGVAKKHGEVSQSMFPGYEISAITNGVHSYTWTCESMKRVYDKHLPGWANEPELFVRIGRVPEDEIWAAHIDAKKILIDYINKETGAGMDYDTLTIGFARRATAYKRPDLLFNNIERLERIASGKIQVIYAGKAHPHDDHGKWLIEKIHVIKERLKGKIKITYLKNYDMDKALKMVSGVDLWLNTPLRPNEASGTSGMKAAHNGVPNFSVLDGWWIEGHIEGFTGWSIGSYLTDSCSADVIDNKDAEDLLNKLETIIIPMYYNDRRTWIRVMQNAIGKNAYYFNSHRMMRRYVTDAYIR